MSEKELVNKMQETLLKSRKELANIDLGITKKSLLDLDRIIEHLNAPLLIMVMGEFSTGKSTFINAIVGEEVTASNATPTTAVITKLRYGENDKIIVHFTDGTEKEYNKASFKRLTSKTGEKGEEKIHEAIEFVERQMRLDVLKYVSIIDSPGLNDINENHSDTTKKFVNNADTVFWMFNALHACSKTEVDAMETLTPRLKPIAIINMMDEIDEDEDDPEEFLNNLRVQLKDKVQAVVGISAKYALEGKLEKNETKTEIGNLKELEQIVRELVLPNRDKFKLNSLVDELGEWMDLTSSDLNKLDDINHKNKQVLYEDYLSLKSKIQQNREILSNIAIEIKDFISNEAKKYNEQAMYLLGILFAKGIVCPKDDEQAEQYLESAALKNHTKAQAALGCAYWKKKDVIKAKFWLEKAAEQNDKTALCLLGSSVFLNEETGEFGDKQNYDFKKAVTLLEKAASLNEPRSQFFLYLAYKHGLGVEDNDEKALYFLSKSAKLGDEEALAALGVEFVSSFENRGEMKERIYEAIDCFSRAAEYGNAEALFNLGDVYRKYGKEDLSDLKSLQCYKKSAVLGNEKAQYWLAKYYGNGIGLDKDEEQAFVWYQKSAEQGNADAQNMLGRCYDEGWGIAKDEAKATEWYKKAAEQGNKISQYNLAVCYRDGLGIQQNPELAAIWLEKAAEQGVADAQKSLADYYKCGTGVQKNEYKAFVLYKKSAEQGNPQAQNSLALCFLKGIGTDENFVEAFHWFKEAAEQGDTVGQRCFALCYDKGWGTEKNFEKAFCWYEKAAIQGDKRAQFFLGLYYYSERGVKKDLEQAVNWFRKAAEQGYANAQDWLGFCYQRGYGIRINLVRAVFWFKKAAEQGYASAQYNLGSCYEHSLGVVQNYQRAVYWYKKAAEQGEKSAQNNLGTCYYYGRGIEKDFGKAVYWFKKSAEQGELNGECWLGSCYEEGKGVEQDYQQAEYWYKKAADKGVEFAKRKLADFKSGEAQYNVAVKFENDNNEVKAFSNYMIAAKQDLKKAQFKLGVCYKNGKGVTQDYQKAVEWFKKAAAQGHADATVYLGDCYFAGKGVAQSYQHAVECYRKVAEQGWPNARIRLGDCYYLGKGVAQSYQQAVKWYRKAAEQGDADAQNNLGNCFYAGKGVSQNYQQAVEWFRKAAEQGHADAQDNLGSCYCNGKGVCQDDNQAVFWYRKSAKQGYHWGQYNLGSCYAKGRGVDINIERAIHWLTLASEQGNKDAKKKLDKLSSDCFITTAVCSSLDKEDDCYELQAFRTFRDTWLLKQIDGWKIISEYYILAPGIVNSINRRNDSEKIYSKIWNKYLCTCLTLIENQQYQECKQLYKQMVQTLERKYCKRNRIYD